ncbi:MAG: hypothetical protein AB1921_12355 [Thermodesulfobacteriota bacterium]
MSAETTRSSSRVSGFNNEEFDFQLMRSLGVVSAGGGAVGEFFALAFRIEDGNPGSWVENFSEMGRMVLAEAEKCRAAGRTVSARDLFGRASMHFRAAEYFEDFDLPGHRELGLASRDAFVEAYLLFTPAVEPVDLPFGTVALPGYFSRSPHKTGRNSYGVFADVSLSPSGTYTSSDDKVKIKTNLPELGARVQADSDFVPGGPISITITYNQVPALARPTRTCTITIE